MFQFFKKHVRSIYIHWMQMSANSASEENWKVEDNYSSETSRPSIDYHCYHENHDTILLQKNLISSLPVLLLLWVCKALLAASRQICFRLYPRGWTRRVEFSSWDVSRNDSWKVLLTALRVCEAIFTHASLNTEGPSLPLVGETFSSERRKWMPSPENWVHFHRSINNWGDASEGQHGSLYIPRYSTFARIANAIGGNVSS